MNKSYKNSDIQPQKGHVIENNGVVYNVKGVSKDRLKLYLEGHPMTTFANTRCSNVITSYTQWNDDASRLF